MNYLKHNQAPQIDYDSGELNTNEYPHYTFGNPTYDESPFLST